MGLLSPVPQSDPEYCRAVVDDDLAETRGKLESALDVYERSTPANDDALSGLGATTTAYPTKADARRDEGHHPGVGPGRDLNRAGFAGDSIS